MFLKDVVFEKNEVEVHKVQNKISKFGCSSEETRNNVVPDRQGW